MRYPEVLSLSSRPSTIAYAREDAILYALSVGAGLAPASLDERDLRFVYEKDLEVLPSFATNLLGKDESLLTQAGIDLAHILHSEQRLTMHKPLPPEGRVTASSRVLHVADKGPDKGAVVHIEHVIADAASAAPYATVVMTVYCRGNGGFGGPVDDVFVQYRAPSRSPDHEVRQSTMPNQAALYRLSIGETTPLHIDPQVARQWGFERPLLHGLCTYGFACRALLDAWCDGVPARMRTLDARFAAPFYPGETLVTRSWRDGGVISFECHSAERQVTVLRNGRSEIL